MEGYLCDAALRGSLVGLHHQVGSAEIAVHFVVGYEVRVHHHAAVDVQPPQLVHIRLRVAVELAGHDELHAHVLHALVGHGVEQQVETLVVAYEAEEEHIALALAQPYQVEGFLAGKRLAVVVVERVRTEHAWLLVFGVEEVGIGQHRLRHGHHAVDRSDEVFGKQPVAGTLLVGYEIVEYGDAAYAFAFCDAQCGA